MLVHISDDGESIRAECSVSLINILVGEGWTLANALRDLAMEIDDFENEVGYEVY